MWRPVKYMYATIEELFDLMRTSRVLASHGKLRVPASLNASLVPEFGQEV